MPVGVGGVGGGGGGGGWWRSGANCGEWMGERGNTVGWRSGPGGN